MATSIVERFCALRILTRENIPARRRSVRAGMSDLGRHSAITVLAADRHPLFLDAVARTIRQDSGMQLVGEECDGRAALAAIRRLAPDVAVVDGALPQLGGDRVLQAVSRERLRTRVLLLSGIVD